MANEVDIDELDASDLSDILSEIKGAPAKVKNVANARKELAGLLETKGLTLTTDDEGNFVLNPKKAKKAAATPAPKAKVKAKPEPEPEEEEEAEEEPEEEAEEEAEEEPEEEAEEEVEEEAPPPKKKVAAKPAPAPAPAPKAKVKAKAKPEPEEEEAEEEEAEEEAKPKAKRAPPPREARYKAEQKIKVLKKESPFKDESKRDKKFAALLTSKTVGEFSKKCQDQDLPTPVGFLAFAVKQGLVQVI